MPQGSGKGGAGSRPGVVGGNESSAGNQSGRAPQDVGSLEEATAKLCLDDSVPEGTDKKEGDVDGPRDERWQVSTDKCHEVDCQRSPGGASKGEGATLFPVTPCHLVEASKNTNARFLHSSHSRQMLLIASILGASHGTLTVDTVATQSCAAPVSTGRCSPARLASSSSWIVHPRDPSLSDDEQPSARRKHGIFPSCGTHRTQHLLRSLSRSRLFPASNENDDDTTPRSSRSG